LEAEGEQIAPPDEGAQVASHDGEGQVASHDGESQIVPHDGANFVAPAHNLPTNQAHPTPPGEEGPEMWLTWPGHDPVRFAFDESPRQDAAEIVSALRALGFYVRLLSGDHTNAVARIAAAVGIDDWRAEASPVDKVAAIEVLSAAGHRVLMVGDGLNDGPSLAAAHVSASPTTAADVSQTVADVVFQGPLLAPVLTVLRAAKKARSVMRQNLALSIGYNLLMVPLAIAGFVTPWLAAAAMSGSSVLVISNSFRARSSWAAAAWRFSCGHCGPGSTRTWKGPPTASCSTTTNGSSGTWRGAGRS
jgi:cation transport ATPase